MTGVRLEVEGDGIGWLRFDGPAAPGRRTSLALLRELDTVIEEARLRAAGGELRALVLHSGSPAFFFSGWEVEELRRIGSPEEGVAHAREGQRVLRRLEQLPVPTLAALNGACTGAGAELALACGYRVGTDAPGLRFALPQVRSGLVPELGGTVRLPRLVGMQPALEMILSGRPVDAAEALHLGLLDAVLPAGDFAEGVGRFARARAEEAGGQGRSRRKLRRRLLEETAPGRRLILLRARRGVRGDPSPVRRHVLDAVAAGIGLPPDEAFEREAHAFGRLVVTPESRALHHASRLLEDADADAPSAALPEEVAVLGAGRMGAATAHLLAAASVPVRLREVRREALVRGMRSIEGHLREEARSGRIPKQEAEQRLSLLQGTLGFGGFGAVDGVFEAVPEALESKRAALREVEEHVRQECWIASIASAIPLSLLREGMRHPERVVGIRFFHPFHRTRLAEIVAPPGTTVGALDEVASVARHLGKVPVVVGDAPGFLLNRLLASFLAEAVRLVQEGATVAEVDGTMARFGMRPGPLRLLDEIGLPLAERVIGLLHEAYGTRMEPPPLLARMTRAGRQGTRAGLGFYRYPAGRKPVLDPTLYRLVHGAEERRFQIPEDDLRDRMLLGMVNEAARLLEEGVVEDAATVDLAILLGTSFPALLGGLLYHADALGIGEVEGALGRLAERYGERFVPAPFLRRMAEEGRGFYGAYATGQARGGTLN